MRPRSHVTQKERRRLTLSGFRGVDLTSNPLEVSSNRATYMRNFINDGGVNHKRPGWRELVRCGGKINGIFEYTDGAYKETIFQSGARFYRITGDDTFPFAEDITDSCTYSPAAIDHSLINPESRSQGFMLNGALYIIGCGDFLVYEFYESSAKRELRRVYDNEKTYIPTTTALATGYYLDSDGKFHSSEEGVTLDDLNILSSKRKNTFIGYATKKGEQVTAVRYNFDGIIWCEKAPLVEIVAENYSSSAGGTVYTDGKLIGSFVPSDLKGSFSTTEGNTKEISRETLRSYIIRNSSEDPRLLYEINEDGSRGALVGMVNWGGSSNGVTLATSFYLYSIYAPLAEGQANISATFMARLVNDGAKEKTVTECAFGVRFGTEKIADRLFLGGNPKHKNIDFYSEEQDFTYFGELNTAALGDSSTSIEGYAKLSDSSLVVYKSDSNTEPSFFFRTARYYDEYDDEGNIQKMYGIFPHTEGGIGEGVISRYAHANLCGDVIFLSRSGVHGIVLSENMMTTERYMRERSRNIRNALASHSDLSEAVGIVYNNRYYLAVDGLCYVGDARYKFEAGGDIDGSYNYEWWVWDNIPARVWGKIGTDLYFGTEDGRVCVFDGEFVDRTYDHTEAGELLIDNSIGDMIFNTTDERLQALCEGDYITLISDGVYALIDEDMKVANGRIYTTLEALSSIFEGMEVYVNDVGESGLLTDAVYTIGNIDRGDGSYMLYLDGEAVVPAADGFKLFVSVSGKQLYIADDPSDGRFAVKEHRGGRALRLAIYDDAVLSLLAVIEHRRNVCAEWVTPVTDLGTSAESKSLIGLTLSARPVKNGKLSFGYETRRAESMILAQGLNSFSLDEFSFIDFSFDTGFQNSYSVRCRERNFNYIVFRFVSDSDTDCVINGLTIDYKINKSNKGVR